VKHTTGRKRGRPARDAHARSMSFREHFAWTLRQAAPAFYLAELLETLPPMKGRERYQKALALTKKEFNLSKRTVERRRAEYKELVNPWTGLARRTMAQRDRILNLLKTEIAAGRGSEQADLTRLLRRPRAR
jgi:hypothetical protein